MTDDPFHAERIAADRAALGDRIVATPTVELRQERLAKHLPQDARVWLKLEHLQQAGSFKARGVLLAIDALSAEQRSAGVTAVSAGNHALAVSWGARSAGLSAKVVMPRTADPVRVAGCEALGARVVLADDVGAAFAEADRLVAQEGRTMLHPFESQHMVAGAATVGDELAAHVQGALSQTGGKLDVAVVPVGGGGLLAGMAGAIRARFPDCEVIGVEPFGADSMHRSFEAGAPVRLDRVNTVADSLGAPMALPGTFTLARQNVARIVRLEDETMRAMMGLLFDALKIAAEPACAASLAAVCGPLREELAGKRVAAIACGSNISLQRFTALATFERSA